MKQIILGIDEAGRGAWAGPLVAAAVIIDHGIPGLTDSKKLTKARREKLLGLVQRSALDVGIGWVHAHEIDQKGLSAANGLAMKRAVAQITQKFNLAIIDGNIKYIAGDKFVAEIKADSKYPSVSAASIVAKVMRDRFMAAMSIKYPEFSFDGHVGYGAAKHASELAEHGPTKIHRFSYKPVKEAYEYSKGSKG